MPVASTINQLLSALSESHYNDSSPTNNETIPKRKGTSQLLADALAAKIITVISTELDSSTWKAARSRKYSGRRSAEAGCDCQYSLRTSFAPGGKVCCIISEEEDELVHTGNEQAKYVIANDPLDGSSNIGVNVSIALSSQSIADVHNLVLAQPWRIRSRQAPNISQRLRALRFFDHPGTDHRTWCDAFTYEPSLGNFFSHRQLRFPDNGKIYSCNEGNFNHFCPRIQAYLEACRDRNFQGRYIGSLVADYRNLLKGGIYLYPPPKCPPRQATPDV